jgi:hypothetical protein
MITVKTKSGVDSVVQPDEALKWLEIASKSPDMDLVTLWIDNKPLSTPELLKSLKFN